MDEDKKPEGLKRHWYFQFFRLKEWHIYLGKPYDEYCLNFDTPWFGFGYAY